MHDYKYVYIYIHIHTSYIIGYNRFFNDAGAVLELHSFEFLGLPCDALHSSLVGMEKQQAATFCMVRLQPDF